jgi:hypothetical protein
VGGRLCREYVFSKEYILYTYRLIVLRN